jgi:indole-3-glycerol phosphate synthase
MSGVLERILTTKRAEIDALRARGAGETAHTAREVPAALRDARSLRIIAEVKLKSPSGGVLAAGSEVASRARAYARGGAAMVSVLCDGPFFGGSYDDLASVRAALDADGLALPLLAKEFVLDDVQLARAREAGADAALLIARIVPPATLQTLVLACRARSLEPFVEVASDDELRLALGTGARVIGVNARDLDTLVVDVPRAERILAAIPPDRVAVHLSGVRDPEDIDRLARGRADAVLVGESLMRAADPSELLKRMLAGAAR